MVNGWIPLKKKKMKKIEIGVLKELIELRGVLDTVSQISWSFSVLNKQYPISSITSEDAPELIQSYNELLDKLKILLKE